MLSKVNERRLSVNKYLYLEKLLSTSTEVIGANLKWTKSSGKHSLEASSSFKILEILDIV